MKGRVILSNICRSVPLKRLNSLYVIYASILHRGITAIGAGAMMDTNCKLTR